MEKIAVVGNREGWTKEVVFKKLDEYGFIGNSVNIITGGARGVDSYAMEYAKLKGCVLTVYYPDIAEYGIPVAYYKRNDRIAWECDCLIAFNKNERSGTSQTVRIARGYEKEVIVVNGN